MGCDDTDLLLHRRKRLEGCTPTVGRILKQAAAVKGLDPKKYHPHLLRHCFGTHCHDNGMPVEVIGRILTSK